MHNLATVISFEIGKTVRKKSFWISILTFPVLIGFVFGISYFSGRAAEETENSLRITSTSTPLSAAAEGRRIVALDESGIVTPAALQSFGITTVPSAPEGLRRIHADEADAFIHIPNDPVRDVIEIHARDQGFGKNDRYAPVAEDLVRSSIIAGIGSTQKAELLEKGVRTDVRAYKDGAEAPGIASAIVPGLFLVLFYFLIFLLGNQLLTSTTEEKENRVIEMVLTTVKARTLIIGKIIATAILGCIQIAVLVVPTVIALRFVRPGTLSFLLNLGSLNFDPVKIAVGALLFLCSLILFAGILVMIGAMTPTAKEAGGFFGFIIFLMFVPFYALMAIMNDPGQLIVKVFSFFPLTAPVTLMLRNAIGNLSALETVLGVAILLVFGILAFFLAIRAFRHGVLEYDRKLEFKRLLKL